MEITFLKIFVCCGLFLEGGGGGGDLFGKSVYRL
jgi:hypothetical protein